MLDHTRGEVSARDKIPQPAIAPREAPSAAAAAGGSVLSEDESAIASCELANGVESKGGAS
jgi:hypothetical protein